MGKSEDRSQKSEKSASSGAEVKVRDSSPAEKPAWRTFPGPRDAKTILRVAIERGAHAELIAHAKESLNAEVCGVLAGQVCEDDEGLFVHVQAVIRGTAASQGSTHVTFTQATWNAIHKVLEHDYPKLKIVGWYHTHPGFGVEFSEMDLFIQRNFFGGPTQIALVTDPLNGAVAICANTPQGIEYLERFWVDGREQTARVPANTAKKSDAPDDAQSNRAEPDAVRVLESRVNQLLHAVDELRNFHYRLLMTCGAVFCIGIIAIVGYTIYSQMHSRLEPPRLNSYVPVPIQIGDKTVLLGVGVAEWSVPPELDAIMLQAELLKREAAEKAAQLEATKTNTAAVTNSSDTPKRQPERP